MPIFKDVINLGNEFRSMSIADEVNYYGLRKKYYDITVSKCLMKSMYSESRTSNGRVYIYIYIYICIYNTM